MATSSPVNRLSILFNPGGNTFFRLGLMLLGLSTLSLVGCQNQQVNEWGTSTDAIAWYNEVRAGGGTESSCFVPPAEAVKITDADPTVVTEAEDDPYGSTATEGAVYARKKTTIEAGGSQFYIYEWNTDDMEKEVRAVDAVVGISTADGINSATKGGKCFVISDDPL